MPDFDIRPATSGDVPRILRFIEELAEYERAAHEVIADAAAIERSLFGPDSNASAVIGEQDGQSIGFAVYFFTYSTWLGKHGLYLEDLYVTPAARGNGAGKALLKHLARFAVEQDCGRFEWSVLDWNTPAIAFYESVGAVAQSEWTTYRLTGDTLVEFAAR